MSEQNMPSSPKAECADYCQLGAGMILERVLVLDKQIKGVLRNEDIEFVHKLRVSSRRVGTALPLFRQCIPKKNRRKWVRQIRRITKFSGAARDLDVQLSFLTDYLKTCPSESEKIAIERLVALKRAQRITMQTELTYNIKSLKKKHILEEIIDYCNDTAQNKQYDADRVSQFTVLKASLHISKKLNDLIAMETFVHKEDAVLEHHKMRIAAKRLRYTLEVFSLLYRDGLQDKISLLRKLQDILGELHDLDVWIAYIKSLEDKKNSELLHGLENFSSHVIMRRKSRYVDFVEMWDGLSAKASFEDLRREIEIGSSSIASKFEKEGAAKIALLSDIHGNIGALKAVIEDARSLGVNYFLNAGDSVGFGAYPNKVVKLLESADFLSVIGNFDLNVIECREKEEPIKNIAIWTAVKSLKRSTCELLQLLPQEIRFETHGKRLLLTHGSAASIEERIDKDTPQSRLEELSSLTNADVIVFGHTHSQLDRTLGNVHFINPGSVGRPDDGDPRAEYAILGFEPFSVEFRRVVYNLEPLVNKIRRQGLPEVFAQIFLRGVSQEKAKELDLQKEEKHLWSEPSTIASVRRIAKKYGPAAHPMQDRRLSLSIFDQIKKLHSLGPEERYWLECGAILHDIGLSRGRKSHNKISLMLILNDMKLPFNTKERYIIGSISRYHRRAMPSRKHYNLKPLNEEERNKVQILSAILKVADALDYSHRSLVKSIKINVLDTRVVFECEVTGNTALEDQAIGNKKDLFEKVFGKDLEIIWKTRPIPAK
jgi:putative phosphoesterase